MNRSRLKMLKTTENRYNMIDVGSEVYKDFARTGTVFDKCDFVANCVSMV